MKNRDIGSNDACKSNLHHPLVSCGRRWPWFLGIALAASGGCSHEAKTYPVDGKVVFDDGTAVSGGAVEFIGTTPDGKTVNARGLIDENGAFVLSTFKRGDGAVPGDQQAIVLDPPLIPRGDVTKIKPRVELDAKFRGYQTSGLKFTVAPGENHFVITVRKASEPKGNVSVPDKT